MISYKYVKHAKSGFGKKKYLWDMTQNAYKLATAESTGSDIVKSILYLLKTNNGVLPDL